MNKLIEYIRESLGLDIIITSLDKQQVKSLPLYISASYYIKETTLMGRRICLLETKGEDIYTPDMLYKQMQLVEQKTTLPTVFVFKQVASYNLKRYIQKGINNCFIVPMKQLFIPSLLVDVRKVSKTAKKEEKTVSPLAQFLLLYHLQKEALNGFTMKELSDKLSLSYLNISRAVGSLKTFGLCEQVGGKEKQIYFTTQSKELWIKALPVLQNPIDKTVYTDEVLPEIGYCKSSINALSFYTELNDERKVYYALSKDEFKKLSVSTDKQYGENSIEVWKYNPIPLAEGNIIDRLSLFLIFQDNQDERIQIELQNMMEKMTW
ncbi:hypothetical protein [Bacteroides sp.]